MDFAQPSPPVASSTPARASAASPLPDYFHRVHAELAALVKPEGQRILEVGCGAGGLGAAFLQHGAAEVIGLEQNRQAATAARGLLTAVHVFDPATRITLPYPEGYFDTVVVAEAGQLPDPAASLRQLARYLAPQGRLLAGLPNARHESVALALLVDGDWSYADPGSQQVLERRNLRLFTRSSIEVLLGEAGLVAEGAYGATRSDPSPFLERAATFVGDLEGDPAAFRDEATVVRYLVTARPTVPASRRPPALPAAWSGARPVRVLLAPVLDHPLDRHESAIRALARAYGQEPDVTIGLALPPLAIDPVPASIERVAADSEGDLLLIAEPREDDGWRRLLAGASLFVLTSPRPELERMAREVGVEIAQAGNLGG